MSIFSTFIYWILQINKENLTILTPQVNNLQQEAAALELLVSEKEKLILESQNEMATLISFQETVLNFKSYGSIFLIKAGLGLKTSLLMFIHLLLFRLLVQNLQVFILFCIFLSSSFSHVLFIYYL